MPDWRQRAVCVEMLKQATLNRPSSQNRATYPITVPDVMWAACKQQAEERNVRLSLIFDEAMRALIQSARAEPPQIFAIPTNAKHHTVVFAPELFKEIVATANQLYVPVTALIYTGLSNYFDERGIRVWY